jgi:hypothetical protein
MGYWGKKAWDRKGQGQKVRVSVRETQFVQYGKERGERKEEERSFGFWGGGVRGFFPHHAP